MVYQLWITVIGVTRHTGRSVFRRSNNYSTNAIHALFYTDFGDITLGDPPTQGESLFAWTPLCPSLTYLFSTEHSSHYICFPFVQLAQIQDLSRLDMAVWMFGPPEKIFVMSNNNWIRFKSNQIKEVAVKAQWGERERNNFRSVLEAIEYIAAL